MKVKQKKKTPISQETIFKIMLVVTIVVASAFFLKNLIGKSVQEALMIGASIAVFAIIFLILRLRKATNRTNQMVLSIGLLVLVFIIAINSGAAYSDDFIMFLAIIGMTGLYLEPKFTLIQIILADIFLILMYIVHPEKAESLSQYIQCLVEFTLAGILFRETIKRGRAFIGIGEDRAKEAEVLVDSMRQMGESLERDFAQSAADIDNNTQELQVGSDSIVQSADDMNGSCNDVQDRIQLSQQSILNLNEEVIRFEMALKENQANMETMRKQLAEVSDTVYGANEVFQAMEQKMGEVADIADQLNDISFNTSILSLNASIEAARAGESGAGFEVVATEMRQLSNNSNGFSVQVSEVVKELMAEVGATAQQFHDSTKALEESKASMNELQKSFERLTERFGSLYGNIETQNENVEQVNLIFNDLKARVWEMQKHSENNQDAVKAIIDAMEMYRVNINHVIESTKR